MSTSNHRCSTALHFIAYFCILLILGVFVRDLPGQPALPSTIHSFQEAVNLGDPKYFASGAIDVFQNGWFTPENQWLINLWPPGFMLLEASILRVFGEQAPFIAILLILSALLQAFWMTILRHVLRPLLPAFASSLLPLIPFAFPVSRQFLLEPTGLVLGEAFALGSFLASVLLINLSVRTGRLWVAIAGGLLLGLAAYFRSQYGTIVTMFTLGAVPIALGLWWRLRRLPGDPARLLPVLVSLKSIVFTVMAAQAIMLPWRVYAKLELHRTTWVATQQNVALNGLTSAEALYEAGAGWIVRGGGNIACLVAPEYCGQKDPSLYYRAFIEHPIEWTYRKAILLDDYWFSSLYDWTQPITPQSPWDWTANTLLLLAMLALFPLLWLVRREREAVVYFWILASFFGCFAGLVTLAHLETRYFYLIKIFAVVVTPLLAALAWHYKRLSEPAAADAEGLSVQSERITAIG